jgi:hypothetical protein
MRALSLLRRCGLLVLLALGPVWAAPSDPPAAGKKVQPALKKQTTARELSMPGGSGETKAERSARLKRECKGRPNAGACTGYTD